MTFRPMRLLTVALLAACGLRGADDVAVAYSGAQGKPGNGKHIVLISGDEEYRSEEALPQLARILSQRHGFPCTVLFAIDKTDGTINPKELQNIPGLEALDHADLMIIATRFRELPDEQMKYIDEYVQSGRPIIGLRTATHAFRYSKDSTSRYTQYDFESKTWDGGFGRQVLGETWIAHHGYHGLQATRGVTAPGAEKNPILRGVSDIFGPTDVYTVHLPPDAQPLVLGEVLTGMNPSDPPVKGEYVREQGGKKIASIPNDPMMPVAWTRTFTGKSGKPARVFATTMGAAVDLKNEGLRRLLVNAVYWSLGMEARIPARADVDFVGAYEPSFFGHGTFKRGVKPSDHAM